MVFSESALGMSLEPDRTSRHSLGIHASPAEVWRALTEPDELVRWFVAEAEVDLKPGGRFRWVFGRGSGDPGPTPLVTEGECLALARHETLRLRALIEELETEIEFRIDPWRDGSVLTVTHTGFPGDEEWDDTFRALDRGWQTELFVLKIFLERGRGLSRSAERHERRLASPPEDLFDSFTTQAGLGAWLADRAAIDATPGGEFLLGWNDGVEVRGHVAACDPDRFLLLTFEADPPSIVRIHLEADPEDGSVAVTIDHIRFAPSPGGARRYDWDAALARLEASLHRGPVV